MGLFCANFHFRGVDKDALMAALSHRGISCVRVLSAKGGWTSLYEERASQQDDEWIRTLAGDLARELRVAAIAFLVHDSDVACYWLFDRGDQIDAYNSRPEYFDWDATGDEPSGPSGGRPDVLLPFCRPGVGEADLTAILSTYATFAESVIERVAEAMGIDPGRALRDYRHDNDGEDGPNGFGQFGGDGDDHDGGGDDVDDDGGSGGWNLSALRQRVAGRMAQMFGAGPRAASADPQAVALVNAAVSDDVEAIARLVSEGAAVDVEAPPPLPAGQPMPSLGQLFPGGVPQLAMTPLLAAVAHKRARAAKALIDRGADPNRVHTLFGAPIHAAVGNGDAEMLRLLIDGGGNPEVRNAHGQTALEVIAASRLTLERLAQAKDMMKSLGHNVSGILDQLSNIALPTEGWDRCERLLKACASR